MRRWLEEALLMGGDTVFKSSTLIKIHLEVNGGFIWMCLVYIPLVEHNREAVTSVKMKALIGALH